MEHRKEAEAVYFAQEDSHIVMSEKVQALAGSIYQEFERMITKYDEGVVKDLMPLVVNVLESLDLSYTENQEHEVEVELLREDNEQLVTQYEREKGLRKTSEQKLLEIEDQSDEMIKEQSGKIESLEAILRMLELRAKNSADHVARLEEKENEMKKEYAKLHDRYTELFKTHMDYMERTKILMGTDRLENFGMSGMNRKFNNLMTRSAGPISYGFESLANNSMMKSLTSPDGTSLSILSPSGNLRPSNIQEEMSMDDVSEAMPDSDGQNGGDDDFDELSESSPQLPSKSKTKKEERTSNTLYQECSFQDPELAEESSEITGSWVHPGEYASNVNDNFFGMGKEVENLILENSELLATKNALNIVKDDLIAKVDELTSEQEILREEIASINAVKSRMKLRIQEVEEELKRTKEELDKKVNSKSDDEEDVPLAQRKRFTRVEMARVLMERNQYKERYMELQDAVRWTEMLRAAKQDPALEKRNNRGILNFFSNLFSKGSPQAPITTDRLVSTGGMGPHLSPTRGANAVASTGTPGTDSYRSSRSSAENPADKTQLRRLGDPQRRDQSAYSKIKAHVRKDDGRMQAYGWSLPAKAGGTSGAGGNNTNALDSSANSRSHSSDSQGSGKHLPVPVPIYCRPFMEQSPGMKIFCASGVNLGVNSCNEPHGNYASHVWVCTATHSASRVTIIDANRPAEVLHSFEVCSSHLLCIASVPGAEECDLHLDTGIQVVAKDAKESTEDDEPVGVTDSKVVLRFITASLDNNDRKQSTGSVYSDNVSVTASITKSADLAYEVSDEAMEGMHENDKFSLDSGSLMNYLGSETESDNIDAESVLEASVSSRLPTVWLGAQNGFLYIHSTVSQRKKCLHKIGLRDSILSIAHLKGRTFVSMANGTVAIFRRDSEGRWDFSGYYLLDWGQPQHSIRCLSVVHGEVWCGFRNKIYVIDVVSLQLKKMFEAHPRKESQVRQMAWCDDGVWISIRLDSTLRLYHARTYEHLQDVDIEPYVSKMLGTGKLGFSYARITALLVSSQRLWIGTGNGVIISVPLSESSFTRSNPFSSQKNPGTVVRISGEEGGAEIPYCSMPQAQLSFHGHRDAVKFFVAVPGGLTSAEALPEGEERVKPIVDSILILSGGEGYLDFRVVDEADGDTASHLIVWKLPQILDQKNPFVDFPATTTTPSLPEDP